MRIGPEAIIAREKLTQYLLVPRAKNDKSRFLEKLGFGLADPEALEAAIRAQAASAEAVVDDVDEYGTHMTVTADLVGPGGTRQVVSVWVVGASDNKVRFVTLKPSRS